MTNAADAGHYDLDALAELDEGLRPDSEAQLRAHLDGCPQCSDRFAQIRTTRALLSTLPTEPMPQPVVERVTRAVTDASSSRPSTTIVPIGARRQWWRSPAIAGVAAAVFVALLAAGIIVGSVASGHHKPSPATTSQNPNPLNAAGSDQIRAAGIKEWQTGTNYTAAAMKTLVPRLVRDTPTAADALRLPAQKGAAAAASPTSAGSYGQAATSAVITVDEMRTSRLAVARCGHILADDASTIPLAIDFARFAGKPAVIVVLPAVGEPGSLDAIVLQGPCSSGALFQLYRVPRG